MKTLYNKSLCLLFIGVLAACEKAPDTIVNIPDVRVGCTVDDSTGLGNPCSSANINSITAFVRMSRSGCGDSLNFEPIATGSVTMNCDTAGCDGIVTDWTNPETSDTVNEILTGRMDVCAQVDLDGSGGLPDTDDLINEDSQSISSSATITVDTWSVE